MDFDESAAREFAASRGRTIRYVYFLRKGPAWSADSTPEIDALQEAHLANLQRLAKEGWLILNGPLLDSLQLGGDVRGMGVLDVASMAEARALVETDPMVRAGRLVFEVHAWMVREGVLPTG